MKNNNPKPISPILGWALIIIAWIFTWGLMWYAFFRKLYYNGELTVDFIVALVLCSVMVSYITRFWMKKRELRQKEKVRKEREDFELKMKDWK